MSAYELLEIIFWKDELICIMELTFIFQIMEEILSLFTDACSDDSFTFF